MYKNFSPSALGITGRQSELIELALTYGFRGMDIDMSEMRRRASRSTPVEAFKYLKATDLSIGSYRLDIDLDADEETFKTQLTGLHPVADLASQWKVKHGLIMVPACTDQMSYPEFFDFVRGRLVQIAEVLAPRKLRLGIGFRAGKELETSKQYPFIRNAEGLIALVKSVAADNAGYIVDSWDWLVSGSEIEQLNEIPPKKIVTVRLASVLEGVTVIEATSNDRVLPVVVGPLNHVAFVKKLKSLGYDGPIGPSASGTQYKGETREFIVSNGQEAIDEILTQAGVNVPPRPKDTLSQYPEEPAMIM